MDEDEEPLRSAGGPAWLSVAPRSPSPLCFRPRRQRNPADNGAALLARTRLPASVWDPAFGLPSPETFPGDAFDPAASGGGGGPDPPRLLCPATTTSCWFSCNLSVNASRFPGEMLRETVKEGIKGGGQLGM